MEGFSPNQIRFQVRTGELLDTWSHMFGVRIVDVLVTTYGEVEGGRGIRFSAFWLRSSVVSVLISLISDTRLIESHNINLIFDWVRAHWAACCQSLRVSPWYCTYFLGWRNPKPLGEPNNSSSTI
jgi:hypothetical protein